jgi:hypothetical protein
MVLFVTNTVPGSLLTAAAACYHGRFHVKWDNPCFHVYSNRDIFDQYSPLQYLALLVG